MNGLSRKHSGRVGRTVAAVVLLNQALEVLLVVQHFSLCIPVAFFIFNRPHTTERVFAEIARAKPPKLLIVADGPRADRPGEAEKVAAARAIVERVDWPCEVLANYSEINLGCRARVSSGLDWVFETVEEAIVLEDDCLPDPTFFRFCEELLTHYRDDERVMHIGGTNFQFGLRRGDGSYYFSRYSHVWGWASWRRAWRHYDVNMHLWASKKAKHDVLAQFKNRGERRFWQETWDQVSAGTIDSWDYQWAFACSACQGLAIVPCVNLASNIGFGAGATHTHGRGLVADVPTEPMRFPLMHPASFVPDEEADRRVRRLFFYSPGTLRRAFRRAKRSAVGLLRRANALGGTSAVS